MISPLLPSSPMLRFRSHFLRLPSRFFAFVLGSLSLLTAHAQSVHWEPSGGTLGVNQLSELTLVFDQCDIDGDPQLPSVPELKFNGPSRNEQSSFNFINGRSSRSHTVSYSYQVQPTRKGTVTIPSFEVKTDSGNLTVPAATFTIGDAAVGQGRIPLSSIATAQFTLPTDTVWAGEVFPLRYTLAVARRYFYNISTNLDWDPTPLSIEDWSKPELLEATFNGEPRSNVIYKTRALARDPGSIDLKQGTQIAILRTGMSGAGIFAQPTIEQVAVTTEPAHLTVRPLPSPAPADFRGFVGQFTLDSKVVPAEVTVGEPVTWTVTLDGSGNWPDIAGLPPRSVSRDFRVVQPKAQRQPKDNSLFDATLSEDVVLIPTKPGTYTLGPLKFSIFDPKSGSYKTLTTDTYTVKVTAGAQSATPSPATSNPSTPPPAAGTSASSQPGSPSTPPAIPSAPSGIPRDPLAAAPLALLPSSAFELGDQAGSLLGCVFLAWIVFALLRARQTDPARPRREARQRLHDLITRIDAASSDEARHPLILQWQRDTAILFGVSAAVPTAASFGAAGDWAELWHESERLLYAARPDVTGWTQRAAQALAAHRVPGFNAARALLPRNLFPFFFCLFVTLHLSLASAPEARAATADPRAAYDQADFAAAEAGWRDSLKTHPRDWVAHHNLSLALAQQNRWGEAAAHALAAFVQHPSDPAVRWNLELALQHAGYQPPGVAAFLNPDPLRSLAIRASVATWQRLLLLAIALLSLSLILLLAASYFRPRRGLKISGLLLLVVALLGTTVCAFNLYAYGPLAESDTVVVWRSGTLFSVPTEADTGQKTTPLAAGSLAHVDKPFLGWRRLVFANGQTGWVRADELVPLWQ